MRIMIVESDWQFEAKVTRFFENHAHLVSSRTSETALEHAKSWRPELIILSAEYAEEKLLDGLRALEPSPAVLLTEHMSRFDRAWRAWQVGGDELLMKPIFHYHELQQAVVSALEHATLNGAGVWREAKAIA
jgi:DNA-binding response OmpR family regulator